jgi:hypothetical protein
MYVIIVMTYKNKRHEVGSCSQAYGLDLRWVPSGVVTVVCLDTAPEGQEKSAASDSKQ